MPIVYIRFRKKVILPAGALIQLGQVVRLLTDPELETKLKRLPIFQAEAADGNHVLIDILQIIRLIKENYPNVQVEHYGEPHALIEFRKSAQKPRILVIVAMWLLLFVGSGLAIMNFHADVSMEAVHQRIYQLITGHASEHPYWLQIPYSIGIGLGMVLFFNRVFKHRFNDDPSPLEVEMYLYEENVHQYVTKEEYATRQKSDVE